MSPMCSEYRVTPLSGSTQNCEEARFAGPFCCTTHLAAARQSRHAVAMMTSTMVKETPLLIACPRCNIAYPEDEPHECADLRRRRRFWALELAIGIELSVVGAVAGSLWYALAQGGYTDSILGIILGVFTIMGLGLGVWLVVTRLTPLR